MRIKTVGLRYFRRHRMTVLGSLVIGASLMGLGAGVGQQNRPDPATACANLATITDFPITPTQITLARWNPSGTTSANNVPLPDHCQIQGIINQRIGIDGFPYGTRFEVRLPTPAKWNRRFMFQGRRDRGLRAGCYWKRGLALSNARSRLGGSESKGWASKQ